MSEKNPSKATGSLHIMEKTNSNLKPSVFTPVHKVGIPFLYETYLSLVEQTRDDWEWVILLNGGAKKKDIHPDIRLDSRVKIQVTHDDVGAIHNYIGRLKKEACNFCSNEVLIELDCDDLLVPKAIEEIMNVASDSSNS